MFFVRFAFQHIDVSETVTSYQLVEHLDDQLEAISVSESSNKIIPFTQETELFFDCDSFGTFEFMKPTEKIIFAPPSLKGTSLQSWTEDFRFPYTATSFMYLLNKNTRVILVYDDLTASFAQNLDIPITFNVLKIHIKDFQTSVINQQTQTLDKLHLVFFTSIANPTTLAKGLTADTSIITVNLNDNTINFHTEGTRSFFLTEEMLLGAFFAPEHYDCLKDKALKRHSLVTHVYQRKTQLLQTKTLQTSCESKLVGSARTLSTFLSLKDKDSLLHYEEKIKQENELLVNDDCPSIY